MADTKTSTAYKDRYALNGKVEKWMGRGSQVVGGLAAAVGFLSGGSGIFLGALGAALFGSGVARTSRGQMRIAKSNAVNDLVLRSRGMGLKQQMLANAGKSPGMAYINAAAKAKAQSTKPVSGVGQQRRPAAPMAAGDGQTKGYMRVDPRTGKTVQVKGYRTPNKR